MKHHAYMATTPTGEMALAIAHRDPDGRPVLDTVEVLTVTGGDAGIDAVYAGLIAEGITVNDFRVAGQHRCTAAEVKEHAISGALRLARRAA